MSDSNGERMRFGEISDPASISPTMRTTAQLSAQERSKLTDAIIAQVGALTKANNVLNERVTAQTGRIDDYAEMLFSGLARLDAMERLSATRYDDWWGRSLIARLRWLVLGR